jgi:carboxyl-terminal processing protease
MKKTLKGIIIGIVISIVWFVFYTHLPWSPEVKKADDLLMLRKINSAIGTIRDNYAGDIDEKRIADYMFVGMIAALDDPYAAYYTKEDYENVLKNQQGHYSGIGITVTNRVEDDALIVAGVAEEGPAYRAGVMAEDEIISINGTSAKGMTSTEAVEFIQNSEDSTVELEVYRASSDETLKFELEIEEIDSTSVYGGITEDNIGLIGITTFAGNTAEQFKEVYDKAVDAGMEKLIIDLRDNGGGLVSAVCDTLRQILPEGVIVSMIDKNGDKKEYMCDGENELDMPLVVLVNENTASASEIFAGAVQDYGKGTVIGVQTYGKGIVQDSYTLSDGSVIKITVAHYYTPNGNDIHEKGITPDIVVENKEDSKEDQQLLRAVEYLEEN